MTGSPYRGLTSSRSRTRGSSSAGKRPPPRCWTGCRGCWRARACWWCRGCRARGSRRCCGRGCCRGCGRTGWRPPRGRRRGRGWCSPRPGRRWMSWRCGWRCWPGRTRRRSGANWRLPRPGSRSPPGRPPWRVHPGQPGIRTAPRRARQPSGSGGCCWWSTSSRSCSPSAPRKGSGGRLSPRCTRRPPPATARTSPRRLWWCWVCARTLRPGARTTRSWPDRSKTGTWSPR